MLKDVSHTGSYDVIATDTKGIKKIVNVSGGTYHETGDYLVKLNYGFVPTYDKKLQKMVQKEKRTYIRHFCDYFCGMEISKITKNTIE